MAELVIAYDAQGRLGLVPAHWIGHPVITGWSLEPPAPGSADSPEPPAPKSRVVKPAETPRERDKEE